MPVSASPSPASGQRASQIRLAVADRNTYGVRVWMSVRLKASVRIRAKERVRVRVG